MTEYELQLARKAYERSLEIGAPGLSAVMREAIVSSATRNLRHQLNIPAPPPRAHDE